MYQRDEANEWFCIKRDEENELVNGEKMNELFVVERRVIIVIKRIGELSEYIKKSCCRKIIERR